MRKIVLVVTSHCPRCEYVRRTVFEKIAEACPGHTYSVNGSFANWFVQKYGIKGAPAILFLDGEEKKGLAYKEMDVDKIIRWIREGKYNND